jgi:beta-mannosidase
VELDLLAAELIHDPMTGSNVWEMRPYEGYQWRYAHTFPTPVLTDGQRTNLCFGSIDCLADIWLNGTKVGEAENMLIEHDFDVTGSLTRSYGSPFRLLFVLYLQCIEPVAGKHVL